jgi:hypothetical protein
MRTYIEPTYPCLGGRVSNFILHYYVHANNQTTSSRSSVLLRAAVQQLSPCCICGNKFRVSLCLHSQKACEPKSVFMFGRFSILREGHKCLLGFRGKVIHLRILGHWCGFSVGPSRHDVLRRLAKMWNVNGRGQNYQATYY